MSALPPVPLRNAARGLVLAGALLALTGCPSPEPGPPPVPEELTIAENLLAEGRWNAGATALEAVPLDRLPTLEDRLRLARAWMKARRPDRVAEVLAPALDAPPSESVEARLLRAEGLLRSGKFGAVESDLGELERAGLGNERRRVLLAMLYSARGRGRETAEELEPLIAAGTRDPDAWVQWAQVAPDVNTMRARLLEGIGRAEDGFALNRAMGRHLLGSGQAGRAVPYLERAATMRPWHRDARLEWINALHLSGRRENLLRARTEAERLWKENEDDGDARFALAQALYQLGRPERPGGLPEVHELETLDAWAAHLDAMLQVPGQPPARRIALLHARARIHILRIPLDDDPQAEGSSLGRALALLREAASLDPRGQLRGSGGIRLAAETAFLEGRAWRRARVRDDQRATGAYERAVELDSGHLDAAWDLAVLYYDWFRTAEFQQRARKLFETVERGRKMRGLPPIEDPAKRAILEHNRRLAAAGEDFPPGESTPGLDD